MFVSIRARSRASDQRLYGIVLNFGSFNPRSLASERRDGIGGELAQGMFQSALARERRVD